MRSIPARLGMAALALILILTAALPGTLASPQYAPMPPGDFLLEKSGPFDIYYDSTRITDLDDAVLASAAAYENVTAFFGDYGYRNRIILASNHDQYANILYNYLTSEDIPAGEVASDYGDAERGTIVIEAPDQISDFEAVLAHEFAQIALRTELISNKYNIPEWFSDGLATYIAGGPPDADRALVEDACRSGKMMTVAQMQDAYGLAGNATATEAEARLASAQAGMLVQYVAEKYGDDRVRLVLQDYGTLADLDKAFQRRLGYSAEGICADWQSSLKAELSVRDGVVTAESVRGYVTDAAGQPIANQSIVFICQRNDSAAFGKAYSATTTAEGFYRLNLTYGPFKVQVSRPGYAAVDMPITIGKGEYAALNVTLLQEGVASAGVVDSLAAGAGAIDDGGLYIALVAVNVLAALLIAIVVIRSRK